MTTLVLVLGDQLSLDLAALKGCDPAHTVVLMAELHDEATYVKHHAKKIAFVLSAMRHHAEALREAGWRVDYIRLDDPNNCHSFTGELQRAIERHRPDRIRTVEAGEWRVIAMQESWADIFALPVDLLADDRFFVSRQAFAAWAEGRKSLTMEFFYREQRKATGLLMQGREPAGGQWNFDAENRKPPARGLRFPERPSFPPDAITREVMALVAARFPGHFGAIAPFALPVTRADARAGLDWFVAHALPQFGDYQDAMVAGEDFLFHAWIAPALNIGLLSPREVCAAAEAAWASGEAPLNAVEGFIRQILGWREYVRGIYFHAGPDYHARNALAATRPLPDFYWTGNTDMRCLAEAVRNTRDNAYAHHIQRLMVLGNFAMLAGCSPQAVSDWFLAVYADAYAWVEEPNVIGMSQFADGGLMASKPYAGSGAYINRMSDYCSGCRYDVKARVGPNACPFNALYWDFLARNAPKLRANQRLRNPYGTWDRFAPETQAEIRTSAAAFLATLTPAAPGWARHPTSRHPRESGDPA